MRTSSKLQSRKWSIIAAIALSLTVASAANAQTISSILNLVYPPNSLPAFKPFRTHAANWWKWALTQPADKSPLLDTTGAFCKQGQSGSVFYLAGTLDGGTVTRNCTVPNLKTIVFPVVNGLGAAFPTDPAAQRTEEFLRAEVEYVAAATNLSVTLDGVSISNPARYYEESDLFSVTLPANNVFGLPTGQQLSPAVDAGFYLAFNPLLPGKHTLKFKGTVGGVTVDVTYNLTVSIFP